MQADTDEHNQQHQDGDSEKPRQKRPKPPYDPSADIVRPRHFPEATGLSQTTIWRLRRRGQFPELIRLTPGSAKGGAKGLTRAQIAAWLAGCAAKSGR